MCLGLCRKPQTPVWLILTSLHRRSQYLWERSDFLVSLGSLVACREPPTGDGSPRLLEWLPWVCLSLKSYPAVISYCTRRAVSKPVACSCHHLSQQAFEDVPPPAPPERSQKRTKCGVPMKSLECLIRVWVCTFSPWQRRTLGGGFREESKVALPSLCKCQTQVARTATCVYYGSWWQK